jgi:hypothetical protein
MPANWKKVIVSGSTAELANLTVDNNLIISSSNPEFQLFATGLGYVNQRITQFQNTTFLTGSFSGSFYGSAFLNLPDLTGGAGISPFLYDGQAAASFAVSGAAQLADNFITKWQGADGKFVNTNITDNGSTITVLSAAGGGLAVQAGGLAVQAGGINVIGDSTFNNSVSITGTGSMDRLVVNTRGAQITGDSFFYNNLTVQGNLTVNGTASFINTENVLVKDKFILIASGSSTLTDAGIIAAYDTNMTGSAFYLSAASTGTYGRWAVAYGAGESTISLTPNEFVNTTKIDTSAPISAPTWGGATNGVGNMFVRTTTSEIFIWA